MSHVRRHRLMPVGVFGLLWAWKNPGLNQPKSWRESCDHKLTPRRE